MKYCDSKVLEVNWFNWLVSDAVPDLEIYRKHKLLYTKIIGTTPPNDQNKSFPDPCFPTRTHVIVASPPVFLNSYRGKLAGPHYFLGNRPKCCKLPDPTKIIRLPESEIAKLVAKGYTPEPTTEESWHKMLCDLMKMCSGIASKFNLPCEEAKYDLANDAMLQVSQKIKLRKLVYMPGRAPVFNLLTTTIHRIVFSILNKETKERHNRNKHCSMLAPLSMLAPPCPITREIERTKEQLTSH